ncbi:hypothetical protein PybrP1_003346 [[Pythium] brassicae (nom. inval.)]|nr:hypothetical protein PybrP1_003346 [[Pythium] brassicae (nom. inval.)]
MRQLVALENEQHARAAGRAFAKQVFGRVRWTRLGAAASNTDVKLYESAASGTPAAEGRYTVRAVRRVRASIAEVEVVLATAARYGALAVLLPGAYASGGLGVEFGEVRHATGEREHASVEFARLRPYAGILGMEHHVLLSYSLATVLQRTRRSKRANGAAASTSDTVAVPAVLHLLRPVDFPALARKRRDFQRDYLALNDFSITYIVQETSAPGVVELEVLLACSDEERLAPGRAAAQRRGPSQKQRMWQDALNLTAIMQLVDNYRASRSAKSAAPAAVAPAAPAAPTAASPVHPVPSPTANVNVNASGHVSGTSATSREPIRNTQSRATRAATLPTAMTAMSLTGAPPPPTAALPGTGGGCCLCHKRFGPFRWKHHCEVCASAACDGCLSVIANPAAARKKKRVCNNCLYGPSGLGAHAPPPPQRAPPHAGPAAAPPAAQRAGPPRRSTLPSAAAAAVPASTPAPPKAADRRYSAPAPKRTTRSGSRAPPPVPEYDRSSKRYTSRSRASSRASSRSGSSVYSDSGEEEDDDDGGDGFAAPLRFARRAQTVTIEEVPCRPVAARTRSFRMAPSYRASFSSTPRAPAEPEAARLTTLVPPEFMAGGRARASSALPPPHELRTPAADYELDFDWLNIFPKVPAPRCDPARVYFLDTALKLDPQSVVFLRHDPGLETLAHRVLDAAPAWHGCSINVVGKSHVYCLVNASAEMDATSGRPAVVVDDVMPRAESASAYAVYHNTPFFVPALAADDRFRAHPLVTDHGAAALLSFPLYASSGAAARALAREVSARVQGLAAESAQCLQARPAKAYSVDSSSCDSRTSTRHDDSFELDQFQFEPDAGDDADGSPPRPLPPGEDLYYSAPGAASFFVKGRSQSLGGDLGPWRGSSSHSVDNSDNESTTSSCSNSSRTSTTSSRYSSRYSAAELHSAIESLLHQANETSNMVYSTSVTV